MQAIQSKLTGVVPEIDNRGLAMCALISQYLVLPVIYGRIAIGTAVMGGMLTATVLAIFFVPLFFVMVRMVFRNRHAPDEAHADTPPAAPPETAA